MFPPVSFDATVVAPLTPNEFIQRILVPEVGVRLIMQDKHLTGDKGTQEAVKILRDSATYGVAMFPEDGGEWGGVSAGGAGEDRDEGMGAADMIVMERAQRRRKELQEEEREEDEIFDRENAAGEPEGRATGKRKGRNDGKGKHKAVERTNAPEAEGARNSVANRKRVVRKAMESEVTSMVNPRPKSIMKQTPRPDVEKEREGGDNGGLVRPKPRPIQKRTARMDAEMEIEVEDDARVSIRPRPKRKLPSIVPPAATNYERVMSKRRRAPSRSMESKVGMDRCGSSDSFESFGTLSDFRNEMEAARKQAKGKTKRRSKGVQDSDAEVVEATESDAEATPRPRRIAKTKAGGSPGAPSIQLGETAVPPLVIARERKQDREQR
jgi:hypothetical protein